MGEADALGKQRPGWQRPEDSCVLVVCPSACVSVTLEGKLLGDRASVPYTCESPARSSALTQPAQGVALARDSLGPRETESEGR